MTFTNRQIDSQERQEKRSDVEQFTIHTGPRVADLQGFGQEAI